MLSIHVFPPAKKLGSPQGTGMWKRTNLDKFEHVFGEDAEILFINYLFI